MLILTRYPDEEVEIIATQAATIRVIVLDVMSTGVVKLGFDGPAHVKFLRDNAKRRAVRPAPTEQGDQDDPKEDSGNR